MNATSLPLTKENLNKLQNQNHLKHQKDEIFSRFYQELMKARHQKVEPNPQKDDVVVASPKVLPFPYHNDCMFLPTAEHIQYKQHYCSTDASQSVKTTYSSSFVDSNVSKKRPKSMPLPRDSSSMTTSSSFKKQHHWERKSLASQYEAMITSAVGNQGRLSTRSSFSSISTSCSKREKEMSGLPKSISRKPKLLKRLLRLFKKQNKTQESQAKTYKLSHHGPVWYCQYATNP